MISSLNINISEDLRRTLRRFGWVTALLIVAIVVVSMVERKGDRQVSELLIGIEPLPDGELLINDKDVRQAIETNFDSRLGERAIATIDVRRLEEVLEQEPFILDADVYIDAGDRMKISIVQRQPILRVIGNNGLNYYLDIEGIKMPPSPLFTARVIVATGNLPPHEPRFLDRKRNSLKDVFLLVKMIRKDEFLNALVEQVHVTNRGEITLVPKVGNQKIVFGRFEAAEKKLKRLKVFYKEALPREDKGWNKYSEISLQYDGQVVCKKR